MLKNTAGGITSACSGTWFGWAAAKSANTRSVTGKSRPRFSFSQRREEKREEPKVTPLAASMSRNWATKIASGLNRMSKPAPGCSLANHASHICHARRCFLSVAAVTLAPVRTK